MKKLVFLGVCVTLASCGVDGAPKAPPVDTTPPPGVSVSGDIRMGVVTKL